MSDFPSVLPPNATLAELALERSLGQTRPDPGVIATLLNPATCPVDLLGWLAWSFSVDTWDVDWTEDRKRAVIVNSIAIHRIKGSRPAVERALSTVGFAADITEWFEYGGPPGTFRIDAFGDDVFEAGFSVDETLLATVKQLVDHIKPASAHFDLRVGQRYCTNSDMRTGYRLRRKHRACLAPCPVPKQCCAGIHVRIGRRLKRVHRDTHILNYQGAGA